MKALEILGACRERGQKRAGGLDLNEAIAELEALQSRSCEGCRYYTSTLCPVEEFSIASAELEKYPFYCNRYEQKETK